MSSAQYLAINALPEYQKESIDGILESIRENIDTARACDTVSHQDIYGMAHALREALYLADTLARYARKVGIPENPPPVRRRRVTIS